MKGGEYLKKVFKDFVLELIVLSIVAFTIGYIGRDTSFPFPYIIFVVASINAIIIYFIKKIISNKR